MQIVFVNQLCKFILPRNAQVRETADAKQRNFFEPLIMKELFESTRKACACVCFSLSFSRSLAFSLSLSLSFSPFHTTSGSVSSPTSSQVANTAFIFIFSFFLPVTVFRRHLHYRLLTLPLPWPQPERKIYLKYTLHNAGRKERDRAKHLYTCIKGHYGSVKAL